MAKGKTDYCLNDLPKYSPWPARILGSNKFKKLTKSQLELDREYDKQKWKDLLDFATHSHKKPKLKEIERRYFGKSEALTYYKGRFLLLKTIDGQQKNKEIIAETISKYSRRSSSLVELGCGYGSIIIFLLKQKQFRNLKFYGAEKSKNGRQLTKIISQNEGLKLNVINCDITSTKIINSPIPENSIMFTSYVASCIPKLSENFTKSIAKLKPSVVIHYEPCYEHCSDNTTFGLMRKRYTDLNDYNKNLITILKESERKGEIKIIRIIPEIYGLNALFPASIIIWTPNHNFNNLKQPPKYTNGK